MKLIGSHSSPFTRKVRVVMAEKKLEYTLVEEDVWSADTRIQETNPLGKVPCLVLEDGSVMFDSRVIVEYIDTLTPVCKLLTASGGRDRANIKCWEALADGVLDAGILMSAESKMREPAQHSARWLEHQKKKINGGIAAMARGLGEKSFCAGNEYSMADVAVGCALGWIDFKFPEIAWRDEYANLVRLADKLALRASFKSTLPK